MEDSDSGSYLSFAYFDDDFMDYLKERQKQGYALEDHDYYGEYIGIQAELDWWYPRSIADYCIYNTFYPGEPLTYKGQAVPNLLAETAISGSLSAEADLLKYDMEVIYSAIEMEYPQGYDGRRPMSYYTDWHDNGIIDPVDNDFVPMDVDDEETTFSDIDNHPKGLPGCK